MTEVIQENLQTYFGRRITVIPADKGCIMLQVNPQIWYNGITEYTDGWGSPVPTSYKVIDEARIQPCIGRVAIIQADKG